MAVRFASLFVGALLLGAVAAVAFFMLRDASDESTGPELRRRAGRMGAETETEPPASGASLAPVTTPPADETGRPPPRDHARPKKSAPTAPARGGLRGHVTYADDTTPCAEVDIQVTGETTLSGATTDARGAYRIAHLRPGTYRMRLRSRSFPSVMIDVDVEAGEVTTRDVKICAGKTVHGRVLDQVTSSPIAGAVVRFVAKKLDPREVETSGTGSYSIRYVYDLHHTMQITAKHYEAKKGAFQLEPDETGRLRLDVRLTPFIVIDGQVTRKGRAYAPLRLVPEDGSAPTDLGLADAKGRFAVRVPAGRSSVFTKWARIMADIPHVGRGLSRRFPLLPGNAVRGIWVKVAPGGAVAGQVVDADGPRGGVKVNVTDGGTTATSRFMTKTAADGSFRFPHVPSGVWTAEAIEGVKRAIDPDVRVQPRRATDDVHLRLSEGALLAGAVVDAGAKPMARVRVIAADNETMTNDEGGFRLRGLPQGRVTLVARKRGYAVETRDDLLTDTAISTIVMKRIFPITGRVLLPDKTPAEAFWIEVFRSTGWDRADAVARRVLEKREDGAFEFKIDRAGKYFVLAGTKDRLISQLAFVAVDLDLAPPPLEILLEPGTRLTGLVRSHRGDPIANAAVTITKLPKGWARSYVTTINGRFRAPTIAPGGYKVTVQHDEWLSRELRVLVDQTEDRHAEITLTRGGGLEVEVLHSKRTPVPGARVELFRPGENGRAVAPRYPRGWGPFDYPRNKVGRKKFNTLQHWLTHTNKAGDYTRPIIAPGRYRLRVSKRGYVVSERRIQIHDGVTKKLRVRLEKAKEKKKGD